MGSVGDDNFISRRILSNNPLFRISKFHNNSSIASITSTILATILLFKIKTGYSIKAVTC